MKVTSREINLLIGLVGVFVIYILYVFLFNPLLSNLSIAREELAAVELKKNQVEENYKSIPDIKKQQRKISIEAEEKVALFIPNISDDSVITFFGETVPKGGPQIADISLEELKSIDLSTLAAKPIEKLSYPYGEWAARAKGIPVEAIKAAEESASTPVLIQGVDVAFENGTYEQVINQMKAVEGAERTINIKAFIMSKEEDGTLSGRVYYNLYGVHKLTETDDGLNKTPMTETNGKNNPFI